MQIYTYRWSVRPVDGMAVELCATASSVAVARREVRRFLAGHDGGDWTIDGVRREALSASPPCELPPRTRPSHH